MGSAESKVAAQPLGVVVDAAAPSSRPVVTCTLFRKQNKTAPTLLPTATPMPSRQSLPRSSPTVEAVKDAKQKPTSEASVASTNGPPVQLTKRALSLRQLSNEELTTQLLKAVKNGDLKLVERVHEVATGKGLALINVRGMWESTPLIYACQYCHEPVVHWLLDRDADVHLVNEKGVSALLLASLEGMTRVVERVLAKLDALKMPLDSQVGVVYNSAADVNVRVSPLLAASMNGHDVIARVLLDAGAGANTAVSASATAAGQLQLPLLMAAKYGHAKVVRLLMQRGAEATAVDASHNHALLLACEANKEECAVALMHEMQARGEEEAAGWKRTSVQGFTALHFCAVHGLVQAASWMLKEMRWGDDAAFVNAVSATRKESAVLMASRKKQFETVRLLVESGADASLADRGGTAAVDVLKKDKKNELVALWEEKRRQWEETQKRERADAHGTEEKARRDVMVEEVGVTGLIEDVREEEEEEEEEEEDEARPMGQEEDEVKTHAAAEMEEADGLSAPADAAAEDKERREPPEFESTQAASGDMTESSPESRSAVEEPVEFKAAPRPVGDDGALDEDDADCGKEAASVLSSVLQNPPRENATWRSKKAPAGNRRGTGYISSGATAVAMRPLTQRAATMPRLMPEAEEDEEESDKPATTQATQGEEAPLRLEEVEPRHTVATEETERVAKQEEVAITPKGDEESPGSVPSSPKKERQKKKKHKHSRKTTGASGSETSPTQPPRRETEKASELQGRAASIEATSELDDDF